MKDPPHVAKSVSVSRRTDIIAATRDTLRRTLRGAVQSQATAKTTTLKCQHTESGEALPPAPVMA